MGSAQHPVQVIEASTSTDGSGQAAHLPSQADLEEEEALQQALALSRQGEGDVDMEDHTKSAETDKENRGDDEGMDEEQAIQRAIEMSMQQQNEEAKEKEKKKFGHTKKKAYISAIWGDRLSDEESEDEEIANICLMA